MSNECVSPGCNEVGDHEVVALDSQDKLWFCEDHAWRYLGDCRSRLEAQCLRLRQELDAHKVALDELRRAKTKDMAAEIIKSLAGAAINGVMKQELQAAADKLEPKRREEDDNGDQD